MVSKDVFATRRANHLIPQSPLVHPLSQKYSDFPNTQITAISLSIPSHSEGRFANVTDAGRVAVAVAGAFDWGA
jgi:hypothetical protein